MKSVIRAVFLNADDARARFISDLRIRVFQEHFVVVGQCAVPFSLALVKSGDGKTAAGLFFVKRHGRDVILPPYTMINIRFDRSPSLLAPKTQPQGMQ